MRITDKVRIGGIDYSIKFVPNLRDDEKLLYGHILYDTSEIHLSDTDAKEHQRRCVVLWHEMLHGIARHAELDFSKSDEETIITVLARGVYQVLKDNPGMFE